MLHLGTRWVMRVSRLRACQDDVGEKRFVDAFEQRQLTASPSRLSRWEYGRTGSSYRLLRAYEDGAALPPFLLFALNDRQRRAEEDTFGERPTLDVTDGVTPEDVYEILDRVVLGQEVTGSQWYALAAFAAANGYFYLSPANTNLIARRLLDELARSIGAGYLLRFEAMHLFASVARVDSALVEQLTGMIENESTGMIGDAASLILRPRPEVGHALAKQLVAGDTAAAQQSQAWLEGILSDRVPQPDVPLDRRDVVRHRDRLCADLPDWVTAHLESEVTKPLLETALAGRSRLQRHEASLLLMAAEIQHELDRPLLDAFEAESDPVWRRRFADLHQYLVPPSDPGRLEALALAENEPAVRAALWNSRSHVRVPIQRTAALMDQLADPGSQGAVTSALGLSGSVDEGLLDRDETACVRDVLAWWHERGPALTF